jgi:SAM-dependent methyltransferase
VPGEIDAGAARVRAAYARRARLGLDDRYKRWTPANLFIYQERERLLLSLLNDRGLLPLTNCRILDAGCGDGSLLHQLVGYGAGEADLHGVDLLPDRVDRARALMPTADVRIADAQSLPFDDNCFDLVFAFTLLSSVVDRVARARVTSEVARVLRPDGLVVIYDFWVNPFNRDTRPVNRKELRRLFPGHEIDVRSLTLAPPLARLFAPLPGGWFMASALGMLPFLHTHLLAAVQGRS